MTVAALAVLVVVWAIVEIAFAKFAEFSGTPRPELIQTSDLLVEQVSRPQSWPLD